MKTIVKLCLQSTTLPHTPKSSEQLLSTSTEMFNELPKFSVSDTTPDLPQKICSPEILHMVTTAPSSHGSPDRNVVLSYISLLISPSDPLWAPTHSACQSHSLSASSTAIMLVSTRAVTVGIHQLLSCFSLVPYNFFLAQFFFI